MRITEEQIKSFCAENKIDLRDFVAAPIADTIAHCKKWGDIDEADFKSAVERYTMKCSSNTAESQKRMASYEYHFVKSHGADRERDSYFGSGFDV